LGKIAAAYMMEHSRLRCGWQLIRCWKDG